MEWITILKRYYVYIMYYTNCNKYQDLIKEDTLKMAIDTQEICGCKILPLTVLYENNFEDDNSLAIRPFKNDI